MNEEKIKTLLQRADNAVGRPVFARVTANGVRLRIRRRRILRMVVPLTAAAAIAIAAGVFAFCMRADGPEPELQRIASLEEQVRQLQAQTGAALKLVRDVVARERQQQRFESLEAELASIRDPSEKFQEQYDRAACSLLYQGDRFHRELNQTRSAIDAYEQVIRVFPQSRWAEQARERLARIKADGPKNI
ncbi:MAG TPA: hypothetical protein VLI39_20735 [Sedimentisphaerales bacterium]|nr:hypothetical protein [Sedimentisphaerales bacterium]